MAKTTQATGNALTQKLWEEKLFRDIKKESYFERFMATDDNSIVQVKSDLTKKKGDTIYFGIRMRLSGSGVTSGQTLEGNEEALVTYSDSVALERYRHAVRDHGALDRQRPVWDMDAHARAALQDWGSEKIDSLCFACCIADPSKTFYGGDADSLATLEAGDTLTPALISKVKVWAKTGGNRGQTPLRPVKIDGKSYYVLVSHPDAMYDLKRDSEFMQAIREAMPRGESNPIFTGALGVWDGVVLHEHENITIGSSGTYYARGLFLAAQALVWAWGERLSVVAEMFDYQEEHGYAIRMTSGVAKSEFNAKDYGVIEVATSRTQISDA